jgi:tetratricopeptide (TPR) repeat protein
MRAHLTPDARPAPRKAQRLALAATRALAIVLALTLWSPDAAMAQSAEPGAEDLRALIYYLDHDDQRSVQAEMRRLRAQFPRWTPPGDVNQLRAMGATVVASVDVAPIWARIERNDYAGARALIDEARARVPGWSPDAEMLRVLETNESQAAFDEAYARRDATAALAAARRTPALMRCDRINNAWRLAELYEIAGQNANAVSTYRGVLTSCSRISDVVPTLEKANAVASLEEITALFAVARQTAPGNADRLAQLEARLRAGRGGAAAPTAARATTPRQTAPAATSAPAPAPVAAASAPMPSVPVATGPLPLRGDSRIGQVRGYKDQGNWQACLAASANPRSIEILYERAWCAYNLDRAGEALAGFTATAQSGAGLGGDVPRDTRFGMMLAYLAMNMTEEAARLAAATNLTQTQRVEVETVILDQRGVRAYHSGDFGQSIAYLTALEQMSGSLRRDLAMLRAYAYMNNDQNEESLSEFTRLHNELATDETRAAIQSLRGIMSGG